MTTASQPRSVATALEEVARWRTEEEARQAAELAEADQEIASLKAAVAKLEEEMTRLSRFRDEIVARTAGVPAGAVARAYQGVFAALGEEAAALGKRSEKLAAAEKARLTALPEALRKAGHGALLDEVAQFKKTVEPTLSSLPESYRPIVLGHHRSQVDHVQGLINAAIREPAKADGPPIATEIVWAVDAPEGTPEVLMVVLPVSEKVATTWETRGDDLELQVAARVAQAVFVGLQAAGLQDANLNLGGHQGLLVMEVELSGPGKGLVEALEATFARILAAAPEAVYGGLQISVRHVDVDWLLPPEPADEGGEA